MIILASKSASRREMLDAAGVAFESIPADIDERALELSLIGSLPETVARELAVAKARTVSRIYLDRLVLGSDSLVVCDGRRFDKPQTLLDAAEHLRYFSGKMMELHSAAAVARGGQVIWQIADVAHLYVRDLSDRFITDYLAQEWPDVGACVGVFRIEGLGVNLFERIEGAHFTVLGMPLLPVLAALREYEEIAHD